MATFRTYTIPEVREAAVGYGLDPDFVESVYAVESSRGTDPKAMKARSVTRPKSGTTTIVRGPFQLEDDTTVDIIRENKLGRVDVNDPDVHLDIALRLMQKLQKQYNGNYDMMAQAYLGFGTDELGTSSKGYSNKIIAEMSKLKSSQGNAPAAPSADQMDAMLMPQIKMAADKSFGQDVAPMGQIASADSDLFGFSPDSDPLAGASQELPGPLTSGSRVSWRDLVEANRSPSLREPNAFSLPAMLGGNGPSAENTSEADVHAYVQQLVDQEMQGKDYAHG